jgi:hypothetical protein
MKLAASDGLGGEGNTILSSGAYGRRADGNSWWSHLPRTDDVRRTM